MRAALAVLVAVVVFVQGRIVLGAESAPDAGRAFNVEMRTEPVYGVPAEPQRTDEIRTDDGTTLVMQTWLPLPKDGHVPRTRRGAIAYTCRT